MKRKIVFTGGGTGGHVTPAVAISEGLRDLYPDVIFRYVGKRGKVEERMVPKEWSGYGPLEKNVVFVSTTSGSLKNPKVLFQLGLGFVQATAFLLRFRPDAIVATGGYVSAPIVFASGILRKIGLLKTKLLVHEANAELGRMNKAAMGFADKIAVSFPGTKVPDSKKMFVGYPVRKRLVVQEETNKETLRRDARTSLNIPQDAKVVFAFGGSQGARTINRGMVDALPLLLADPQVIVLHGTGKKMPGSAYYGKDDVEKRLKSIDTDGMPQDWKERYRYTDFIDNMGEYYAATDLVVCRGGAGSLVEVCANAIASISIPKANLPGDHQAVNARVLEQLGATKVVYERVDIASGESVESIEPTELSRLIFELLADPDRRRQMGTLARTQYDASTSRQCADIVGALLGDCEMPLAKEEPVLMKERVLGKSDTQLERLLNNVRQGKEALSALDRLLILYKLDGLAAGNGLVRPARACRMFGIGRFTERLDVLLNYALNEEQSPFTRRDACKGLGKMGVLNKTVVDCLLQATNDDYFETVNESLYALYQLFSTQKQLLSDTAALNIDISEIQKTATQHSQSKEFDIRMNALGLLSLLCSDFDEIRDAFEANYFHPNWQVRKRIVECFAEMQKNTKIDNSEVEDILNNRFLQTSNGFETHFQLKEEIIQVYQQESRETFVEDLRTVIYSEMSPDEKTTQLDTLTTSAKEKGLELDIQEVLEDVKDSNNTVISKEHYRRKVSELVEDKRALYELKQEILSEDNHLQYNDVLQTIDFLIGDEQHVSTTR